ncbi:outer membrane beta-barrel protein [Hoeflea prorocentri]|uniref:Outer membrane beta-barrel protein n=1 Tax=Hoeflea prorocentri TaxID=1922333 RepID=A0A9X3UEJ0_9HYPH|nr:outer membrane beta-barrel protein [Hoeflea prorocentri]MCY6379251.1 outer membrane beta-barrel protein [Hoeflea prorocentri]MDA5397052.1 outer membrane beta-barrel protein [Hoeflea prorocentri]
MAPRCRTSYGSGFYKYPLRAGAILLALCTSLSGVQTASGQAIADEDFLLRGLTDEGGLSDNERRRLLRDIDEAEGTALRTDRIDDPGTNATFEADPDEPQTLNPAQPVQTRGTINPSTQPVVQGTARRDEDNPFEPVGIRVGTFIMRPSITQQIAHESDSDGSSNTSRTYSRTVLETEFESDWSRHQLVIGAEQVIDRTISGDGSEDPSTSVAADLRLDLSSTTTANLGLDYQFGREDPTDANAVTNAVAQAEVHDFAAAGSLSHLFGSWRGTATINGGRTTFGSAELSDGTFVSLADRNQSNYTLTLRAGLETGSAYRPFFEADGGQIIYDDTLDASGFDRSSTTYGLRAGVAADFGEKLTGEIAVGYAQRDINDSRLEPIQAFTVDGFATWSPRRGTDVLMGLATTLEDSTTANEPGSVFYAATMEITRQLHANLSANVSGFVGWRDYVGATPNETIFGAGAGFTWWWNRYFALNGDITYEKTTSDGGTDQDDLFVGLGVKIQR